MNKPVRGAVDATFSFGQKTVFKTTKSMLASNNPFKSQPRSNILGFISRQSLLKSTTPFLQSQRHHFSSLRDSDSRLTLSGPVSQLMSVMRTKQIPTGDCGILGMIGPKPFDLAPFFERLACMVHRMGIAGDQKTTDGIGVTIGISQKYIQDCFPGADITNALVGNFSSNGTIDQTLHAIIPDGYVVLGKRSLETNKHHQGFLDREANYACYQFLLAREDKLPISEQDRLKLMIDIELNPTNSSYDAHLWSLSDQHVVFKSMVKPDVFVDYFGDELPKQAMLSLGHVRQTTNSKAKLKYVHPFLYGNLNNGENNSALAAKFSIAQLFRLVFPVQPLPDLSETSDSYDLGLYISLLKLLDHDANTVYSHIFREHSQHFLHHSTLSDNFPPCTGPHAGLYLEPNGVFGVTDITATRPFNVSPGDDNLPTIISSEAFSGRQYFPIPAGKRIHVDFNGHISKPDVSSVEVKKLSDLPMTSSKAKPQANLITPYLSDDFKKYLHHIIQPRDVAAPGGVPVAMGYDMDRLNLRSAELGDFLKIIFAQVTNPNIPFKQEGHVVDLGIVFNGVYIRNPILGHDDFCRLRDHFDSTVLQTSFDPKLRREGVLIKLADIKEQLYKFRDKPTPFIILNENNHNDLSRLLIVSTVDMFLRDHQMRDKVQILLSTDRVLQPMDLFHWIAFGGNQIHPQFMNHFAQEAAENDAGLIENLNKELIKILCTQGVTSLSGAIGNRSVTGNELAEEVLTILGIKGKLGPIGLQRLTRLQMNQNHFPLKIDPDPKRRVFQQSMVNKMIAITDGRIGAKDLNDDQSILSNIELVASRLFTPENPLVISLIGGGVFAQNAVRQLSDIENVKIYIFESRVVNRSGLATRGVSPVHPATRKTQVGLMEQNLIKPNVIYAGGVHISDDDIIALSKLGLVIDASGANIPRQLGIEGEDHPRVISAPDIYERVSAKVDLTGAFSRMPFKPLQTKSIPKWVNSSSSFNPILTCDGSVVRIKIRMDVGLYSSSSNKNSLLTSLFIISSGVIMARLISTTTLPAPIIPTFSLLDRLNGIRLKAPVKSTLALTRS